MNTNIKILLSAFKAITLFYIFTSCANIGTITGGDKDSIPPNMIGSNPVFLDTSFRGKEVLIAFNEFFNLKDINQEFISSPPFKEIPDFKTKRRGLLVKFKEPLKDSITYCLNFGNGIVDYNEGNVLKQFKFVFSTKSNIDSFSIAGNLRNANDRSAPEKSTVMLFENHTDSVPYKELPLYVCKTDSSGDFNIDFIRPGSYKIFAVTDKNSNQIADFFENRAFLDSLIVPKREAFLKIDSLKAGTILHDTNSELTDSLENDTVIITHQFKNSPSNLQLYLFTEDNLAQKILDYSRAERNKVTITFALPVTPDFMIKPINFQVDKEKVLIEKNLRNDTITWWIADTSVQAIDSLHVNVSYKTKDSIGAPIIANDTLIFEYRQKQDKDAWKRKGSEEKVIKKEYLKLNYLAKDSKIDLNKPLRIESTTPLLTVDSTKIKLFEIIDTSVIDTKEQKIVKAWRLQKDLLTFKFKRPIAEEFYLVPLNFKAENWYTSFAADSNRTYTCRITDPTIALMDTLKLSVEFDNHFFMGQIQVLGDSAILPITAYKLLTRKRTDVDKIMLVFDKPLTAKLDITPADFTASDNWYRLSKNAGQDTVIVNLLDKNVINKDTLTFSVKCFDYVGLKNDSVYFTENMRVTFKEKPQFLVSASRMKKEEIKLVFNKKIIENPIIEPLNFTLNTQWFQLEKNKGGDTLLYKITDEMVLAMDTVNLLVKYKDINRRVITSNFSDTLKMINKKFIQINKKTESEQTVGAKAAPQIVHIYIPTDYRLRLDTLNTRQRLLDKNWNPNQKYLLRLDSMAFINIFNIFNQAGDYEFSTPPLDYYSSIILSLKNIKPLIKDMMNDTIGLDSLKKDSTYSPLNVVPQKEIDSFIGQGKIILQLLGEKNILVKEYFVSKDQDITMDYLIPGKYKIKIIFDRNGNGKWDTGDYFKHIQPERVILNGDEIVIKSDYKFILDWNVGESLIKSFSKEIGEKVKEAN